MIQAAGLSLPLVGLYLGITMRSEKYSLGYLLGGLVLFTFGTLILKPFQK